MPALLPYDDKTLFARIATGDETAFRQLFDDHKERLAIFVLQFIHSKADAEEIVQDTFLKIWKRKETLREVEYPKKYIYTMARNQALDLLSKFARDRQLQEQIWVNLSRTDPLTDGTENWLEARESEKLINEALAQLPLKKQKVFQLRRQQGLKPQEIADELNLSLSRVKNTLTEVFRHIKAFLDAHSISIIIAAWASYFS